MSLREDIAKGIDARNDHEAFEAAFARLRSVALEEIVKTHPRDQRQLDRLISTVQIIDAVKQALLQTAAGGDVAEAMLAINPEL